MSLSISPSSSGCCFPRKPWNDDPSAPPTFQILHHLLVYAGEECWPCISLKFLLFRNLGIPPLLPHALVEKPPQAGDAPGGKGSAAGMAQHLQEVVVLDSSRNGSARHGTARHGLAWHRTALLGLTGHGSARLDSTRHSGTPPG